MPQPKHRYTLRLKKDGAQWREWVDEPMQEQAGKLIDGVNNARKHNIVDLTRQGHMGDVPGQIYGDAFEVLQQLETAEPPHGPAPSVFETLTADAQARCMQSLLTQLSDELGVEPEPPDEKQGGGDGGGSGGGFPPPSPPPPSQQPPQAAPQAPPRPPLSAGMPKRPHPQQEEEGENVNSAIATGGGMQFYSRSPTSSVFYSMRDLVKKIAVDEDLVDSHPDGSERWNARKLVRAACHPGYLASHHKMDPALTIDEMYLCLDTSGSVSSFADFTAGIAGGTIGLVHLFSGTEARPLFQILRTEPLKYPGQPFTEWGRESDDGVHDRMLTALPGHSEFYDYFCKQYPEAGGAFIEEVAWMLRVLKPKPGSWLIFWGDGHGPGIPDPLFLRRLVKPYRFVWLNSDSREVAMKYAGRYFDGTSTPQNILARAPEIGMGEAIKLEAAGLPVIWGVQDAGSIRKAFRQLQTVQKRRRL